MGVAHERPADEVSVVERKTEVRATVLEHGEAPPHAEHQQLPAVDDQDRAPGAGQLAHRPERHHPLLLALDAHGHDGSARGTPSALTMSRGTWSTPSSKEHLPAPWTSHSSANRPVSAPTTAAATVGLRA